MVAHDPVAHQDGRTALIVWVASFPRSGNTFLRIVLHRLYGVRTSTVYDVDGVAARIGRDIVGYEDRTMSYEAMRGSSTTHFVKTHRPRDESIQEADAAICLVRDGRDALVSWAHQISERCGRPYEDELRTLIAEPAERGAGSWGRNVLSWLEPLGQRRVVLTYDELVGSPRATVEHVMTTIGPAPCAQGDAALPSFADLHTTDNRFFRRGVTGSHRDELPRDLEALFWAQPDNAAAMARLGWGPGGAVG
jgi:hypothetical protein